MLVVEVDVCFVAADEVSFGEVDFGVSCWFEVVDSFGSFPFVDVAARPFFAGEAADVFAFVPACFSAFGVPVELADGVHSVAPRVFDC